MSTGDCERLGEILVLVYRNIGRACFPIVSLVSESKALEIALMAHLRSRSANACHQLASLQYSSMAPIVLNPNDLERFGL